MQNAQHASRTAAEIVVASYKALVLHTALRIAPLNIEGIGGGLP